MAFFKLAPEDVTDLVNEIIQQHHLRLAENEVTVDVLMAYASGDGHAIMVRGVPALASAKIIRLLDRVAGRGDCQILLDGDHWQHHHENTKRAIIDHELTHFELQQEEDGEVKTDNIGRPKLRMRQHDHDYGWFDEIVRRHGNYAIEARQYRELQEKVKQKWLLFGHDEVTAPKPAKKGRR